MNKVNNFQDYLFNKIFEAVENKEAAIMISQRLKDLVDKIDHPIAANIYDLGRETVMSDKVTLLDYDEEDPSKFTYVIPSKLIDFIEKDDNMPNYYLDKMANRSAVKDLIGSYPIVWTKFRNSASIGKVINKLFPSKYKPNGDPGNDIESFVNDVKMERKRSEEAFDRFKIVEGKDIQKYYNQNSYDKAAFGGSNLGGSCMRHSSCENYIGFYAKNPGVKLVVLMSEDNEDKIVGRALLWDIAYINGNKVERKFMDRIYYVTDTEMRLFKEFAKRNGWLYKSEQNMYNDTSIVDTVDNSTKYLNLETVSTFKEHDEYPYMDTMKSFYYNSGYLTNNNDEDDEEVYFLESTGGDYEQRGGGRYVDYYGERINEDDLVYCELGDDWRYPDDAVWIESEQEYATQDYADSNYDYSNLLDEYIDSDESTYSDYHDSYIYREDSVEVLKPGAADVDDISELSTKTDPRQDSELGRSVIEYISRDGESYYFDEDDSEYFEEVHSLKHGYEMMAHKIWDADRIFTYNGQKYLDDAGSEKKDKLVGQSRIKFE